MPSDNQPFSIDSLDDNMFGGDFQTEGEAAPESTAPTDEESEDQEEEESDEEEESQEPEQVGQQPQDNGPGDLKVALRQAREAERQTKAQMQVIQQQYQELQSYFAAINEREQRAAWEAQLRQEVDQLDPDDVPAYLQAKEAERQNFLQQQIQQQNAAQALTLSEHYARAAFQDYDQQINKVLNAFGPAVAQWALTQENPAMAVYEKAKTFYTADEVEQAIEERVQSRLAEINSRSLPNRKSQTQAPRLNSLPAAAPNKSGDPLKGVRRGLNSQVGSQDWHRSVDRLFEMTAE